MAKAFAKRFYKSKSWKQTRQAYYEKVKICERCQKEGRIVPGEIVHHKIHLSPSNINNSDITLNFNNLELVCRECHYDYHPCGFEGAKPRVAFDAFGNVIRRDDA